MCPLHFKRFKKKQLPTPRCAAWCFSVTCWNSMFSANASKELRLASLSPSACECVQEKVNFLRASGRGCPAAAPVQCWIERGMPSYKSHGSSRNALLTILLEQRQSRRDATPAGIWKGVSFFYSEQKKQKEKKTVAFVLCRKSYTHLCPFSTYF